MVRQVVVVSVMGLAAGALGCSNEAGVAAGASLPTAGATASAPAAPPGAGSSAPSAAVAGAPAPAAPGGGVAGMAAEPPPAIAAPPTDPAAPATAPVDATASGPLVEVPGVPCGPDSTLVWDESNILIPGLEQSGFAETNYQIGGRDVTLHYGCLPEGAPVTFILNLHGTMPEQTLKGYQVPYFRVHRYVDTHNLIVVAPKAVGAQWGVFDGGADEPHLLEIVDWVYRTFGALDIRSMWVAGHSQGALYAKTFVCHPGIADKVRGVVAQAGFNANPLCIDRVSHIHTIGELDMGGVLPEQGIAAAAHGCNPAITGPVMLGNNRHRFFDGCDPGWVHSDYLMLGKGHVEAIDAEVVESILDEIKSAE